MFHRRNTSERFMIFTTAIESPKSVFHTDSQLLSLNLPLPFRHIYRNSATACPYLTPSNHPATRPHITRESQIHSVPTAATRVAFLAFLPSPPEQLPTSPSRRLGEAAARCPREILCPPPQRRLATHHAGEGRRSLHWRSCRLNASPPSQAPTGGPTAE
jgi:hypothetical protein